MSCWPRELAVNPLMYHCIMQQMESHLGILVKGVASSTHSPTPTERNHNT